MDIGHEEDHAEGGVDHVEGHEEDHAEGHVAGHEEDHAEGRVDHAEGHVIDHAEGPVDHVVDHAEGPVDHVVDRAEGPVDHVVDRAEGPVDHVVDRAEGQSENEDVATVIKQENISHSDNTAAELDYLKDTGHDTAYHPSFIKIGQPVRLEYCKDKSCNCGSVHCPFCDVDHYKPSKPSKVRDHLEMKHFAHGVQFKDILVVKCFKVCGEKPSGHYHCPRCQKMLLKRIAFRQHLISHSKKMGVPTSIVKAPSDRLPEKLIFNGQLMELCNNLSCSSVPHLHCSECKDVFVDRSVLITHMWRCQGDAKVRNKKEPRVVHDPDIKQHASIVRHIDDLPVERCVNPECDCNRKYHCAICPKTKFKPSFRTHLHYHYMSHWRKRIPFKDYSILICYLDCQTNEDFTGQRFHYHCPICGETRRRRNGFVHHLRICQGDKKSTHRFSMNRPKLVDLDKEHSSSLVHCNDNPGDQITDSPHTTDVPSVHIDENDEEDGNVDNLLPAETNDDNGENIETSASDDEMFEITTATLSSRMTEGMEHEKLMTILRDVAVETKVVVDWAPGTITPVYTLAGQPEGLLQAKHLLKKRLRSDSQQSDTVTPEVCDKCGYLPFVCFKCKTVDNRKQAPANADNSLKDTPPPSTPTSEASQKRGRGRPRKNLSHDDSVSNTPKVKQTTLLRSGKKRGRPRKQDTNEDEEIEPDPKYVKPSVVNSVKTDDSVRRYSTRGIVKDFSVIAGVRRSMTVQKPLINNSKHEAVIKETNHAVQGSSSHDQSEKNSHSEDNTDITQTEKSTNVDLSDSDGDLSCNVVKQGLKNVLSSLIESLKSVSQYGSDVAFVPSVEFEALPRKRGRKVFNHLEGCPTPTGTARKTLNKDTTYETVKGELYMSGFAEECDKDFRCKFCEFSALEVTDVISHIETDHVDLPNNSCKVCQESFTSVEELQTHLYQIHDPSSAVTSSTEDTSTTFTKNEEHQCSKCSYKSSNINQYYYHREHVHSEMPACPKCGKTFARFLQLNTHLQTVHAKVKKTICHICGKKFAQPRYLKVHLRRHAGIKKHACEVCGMKFLESNSLKGHMETHKPEADRQYKFVCNYCGKRFLNKSNYTDHINKHTGERPHRCPLCNKSFAFKSILDKHKLFIHSTEKPFTCDVCHKSFKLKRLLDQHMISHTGKSNYVCSECKKPFSCKNTLKIHTPKCKGVVLGQKLNPGTFIVLSDQNFSGTSPVTLNNVLSILPPQDAATVPVEQQNVETEKQEENLVVEGQLVGEGSEPALYLCSECNAVFDSFTAAEKHVLLGHSENVEKEELVVLPPEQLENIEQLVDSSAVLSGMVDLVEDNSPSLQANEWNPELSTGPTT